ncbi:MAG: tRNA (N6-isopentenyl adenosine(37)-C2)-methylthiotransferase MiaB [Christensenellales bacterium]|jgi:tRNA-2-methylthio-N6-dimethylallyladenosine synthase
MNLSIMPQENMERQEDTIKKVAQMAGGGKFHIQTFGCQMNVNDSQKLAGLLFAMGYEECGDIKDADVILFNTCCVREGAEKRIYGHVGAAKKIWEQDRSVIIGVCGCMMQQEGAAQELLKRHPYVSIVFGTDQMHMFPQMMLDSLCGEKRVVNTEMKGGGGIAEGIPALRKNPVSAFSTIMYGCDNFCSYCIVPSVRGRERSRKMDDIIKELDEMAKAGVQEVTLLGQNVNSYGKGLGESKASFANLLRRADQVGIPRIRFMTSHPKDISDEVLKVMAEGKNICKQLHLPVQSGSNDILSAMSRRYTAEKYVSILETARKLMPEIGITTDIIVGFPGESDADFRDTLALVSLARFDGAYTFKFSRRRGTKAYSMENQVSDGEKKARIMELIALQGGIAAQIFSELKDTSQRVLVDGISRRSGANKKVSGGYSGRIERGLTVNIENSKEKGDIYGGMADVEIIGAKHNTLVGKLI